MVVRKKYSACRMHQNRHASHVSIWLSFQRSCLRQRKLSGDQNSKHNSKNKTLYFVFVITEKACFEMGNGQQQMVMRVPLAGQCGTVQQVYNLVTIF